MTKHTTWQAYVRECSESWSRHAIDKTWSGLRMQMVHAAAGIAEESLELAIASDLAEGTDGLSTATEEAGDVLFYCVVLHSILFENSSPSTPYYGPNENGLWYTPKQSMAMAARIAGAIKRHVYHDAALDRAVVGLDISMLQSYVLSRYGFFDVIQKSTLKLQNKRKKENPKN